MAADEPGRSREERETRKGWKLFAEYSGLAISLPIAAVLGYAGGEWLDGKLGTGFLRVVGLLMGVAAGFLQLIRKALHDARAAE